MEIQKLNVKQIEEFIRGIGIKEYPTYIPMLIKDRRQSIKKMGNNLQEKYNKHNDEYNRVLGLWEIEKELFRNGYNIIAGIDEAGRGPLAGPVVAAAVILPENMFVEGINDSKKISKAKRESIFKIIKEEALGVGVGIVDNETIDKINILNATKLAMVNAIKDLTIPPQYLLIDALELSDIYIKQKGIIGGDSKSISIAAASIVAKVTRDSLMEEYDGEYPQFKFGVHKGYGTAEHYERIKKYGITPIHRKSFLKNIGDVNEDQQLYKG